MPCVRVFTLLGSSLTCIYFTVVYLRFYTYLSDNFEKMLCNAQSESLIALDFLTTLMSYHTQYKNWEHDEAVVAAINTVIKVLEKQEAMLRCVTSEKLAEKCDTFNGELDESWSLLTGCVFEWYRYPLGYTNIISITTTVLITGHSFSTHYITNEQEFVVSNVDSNAKISLKSQL